MVSDLTKRLRAHDLNISPEWDEANDQHLWCDTADALLSEAADEIERLTAALAEAEIRQDQIDAIDHLDGVLCNFLNIIGDDLPAASWTPWMRDIITALEEAYDGCHRVKAMDVHRVARALKGKP